MMRSDLDGHEGPSPPECGACIFWHHDNYDEERVLGFCRRNPPAIPIRDELVDQGNDLHDDEGHLIGWFPITQSHDWCGEHQDFPDYAASLKAARRKLEGGMP